MKQKNDRYGKLVLLEKTEKYNSKRFWICRCDCGNTIVVYEPNLNKSSACNECNPNKKFGKLEQQTFGNLTVVSYLGANDYVCHCTCGKDVIRREKDLLEGKTISCGCKRNVHHNKPYNDLTGKTFGDVTVVNYIEKSKYLCKCKCGYFIKKSKHDLENCINTFCTHNDINYIIITIKKYKKTIKFNYINCDDYMNILFLPEYNIAIDYINSENCEHNYNQREKYIKFKEKNIRLISIFNIDNKEKTEMFLYNMFAKKNRLYARKCSIKEISKKECNDFLIKNHLQGKSNFSTIHIGLFFEEELVSVMSFGNNRFLKHNNVDEYELYRFCSKPNLEIVGGASKLLKYFEKTYQPKKLMSYSNNDYFSGDVYEKLGFRFVKYDQPRYFWFLNGEAIKREDCQVKKLKDQYPLLYEESKNHIGSKETFIMEKLGAKKITLTGNSIWEKIYA